MIPRHFSDRLHQLLEQFPVVTVFGPRQAGKTTFVKHALPDWQYIDLERRRDRVRVEEDIEYFLSQLDGPIIFDEAQLAPELFSELRGFVDRDRAKKGRIVLLGSASFRLNQQVSETLAGRVGFVDLTPLHWHELHGSELDISMSDRWFRGGFPEAVLNNSNEQRFEWFESYVRTFVERDLPAMGINVTAAQMHSLWRMLAHFHGSLWNASQLASSLSVDYKTVNRYVDILEQAFLIRKLQPYFVNLGKRLVKRPKVYLRDSGLLHHFLDVAEPKKLDVSPNRGASWEGFVIEQIIEAYRLSKPQYHPYFWRTARGSEVDLLMVAGENIIPFEIKLHSSPTKKMVTGLLQCMQDLNLKSGYVVYPGTERYSLGDGIITLPAQKLLEKFSDLPGD
ncbi:MAG: ATP-binding protein [Gammaproteobacteria bacterium]|nr:ATP-binding protein [Gammaproteobacteria bacterium]